MIYEIIGWFFPIFAVLLDYFEKDNKKKLFYLLGLAATILLVKGLKLIFDVPRPEDALVVLDSGRFPSTHAAISFYPLGYFFKDKRKWLLYSLVGFGVLGAYSRIFLKVHLPVDVIVGGLIGLGIGLVAAVILRKLNI